MKPSEEELSFASTSSEFIICEDSEPERLAELSKQTKPSSSSLAIHNSREPHLNKSSTNIIKPNKNELKLASNLTFKSKSPYFQKAIIPTESGKIVSSVHKLSTSNTTRIEESSTATKCSSLDKQSLPENLATSINTTSNAIDVHAEERGTNSIHVETDSSIELGKSNVSRFIDRQSSRGSKSPSIPPKTRIRAISVKSDTISASSNSSSDESVDIPYHTLTRLNSCPACSDDWNTYKAPRSKLTHIKKCAKTNLIRPKDITTRIQKILDKQITNDTDSSSLLDLHIQSKNVQLNILEKDPQVQKSLKNDLLFKPPQQSRSHQPNPSTSGPTHHTAEKHFIGSADSSIRSGTHDLLHPGNLQALKGDTEQANHPPATPALNSGDELATPSPPDLIHSSTLLAQARSRSRTRNSLISSNGKTPYTLWDAAGGHDGFDFQRSVITPRAQ
ncbi:uncharacterized protein MELLADRAFT_88369 [Melampsora larici-populina 98AG31]|uniref:Uncharacterized protein n=1 Tax=Melampsora larici-populina (strain 98AG31 / pathotype 3-4-7) TaxID=747676 RepID=F4RRG9_MELLP|nr:uncharacterized protein MELLADRAFT_88369 [Melampsora larici-populina 98AG31]EGG04934.1 hypothetical protein MELLADRAFT_88369 [Melampsora larici-populina 98AG31]